MTAPKPLLKITNLGKNYAGQPLLSNLNFSLQKGDILCLLGPSGSGKTTLLRLLSGLEQPDQGDILFAGKNLAGIAPHRRHFGMMFQEYALFPHKTVTENIYFGLEMLNWSQDKSQNRTTEMLALVGLSGFENRHIDKLSGGEQQRVALARSLAPQPQLLLLDEPLGSLDRRLRDHLAGEIRSILKSQGVTAIFVTHDQSEAFTVADQIAILHQGKMEQLAPPEQLYRFPANVAVARFLGFQNILDRNVIKDLVPELKYPSHINIFLIRPEGATIAANKRLSKERVCLKGIITSRIFQGQLYSIKLRVGRSTLRFTLALDPVPPQIGDEIELTINPDSIVPLAGDTVQ